MSSREPGVREQTPCAIASRRDFLSAGGALVLGVVFPGCGSSALPKAVQPGMRPGDFAPSAWIRITPDDRVFFTVDRVEMGQGTMTSSAQMVAEELEIDPARLVVEMAGADRAYDNQPDPRLSLQITGGSMSTHTSWEPLRKAGASAREMLRRAAAEKWGAPLAECQADDGAIVHVPTKRRARYGELAPLAAAQDVPEVALKDPSTFKWIGKPLRRLDARAKVDGSAVYGIDVRLPGLVCAKIVRPKVLGAKPGRIDAALARAVPGVVDVLAIPQGVAVVAERTWQAERAANLLSIEWTGGAAWLDTDRLRESYIERAGKPATVARSEGDVGRAERDAAKIVEALYELPYLAHATMEPQNATAVVTSDRCEVWAPTQAPGLAKEAVRRITGLSYDSIVFHQTMVGGGFGRRLLVDYVEEAVQVALRVGKPVKVVWSREDDMRHGAYRPMVVAKLRGAVDAQGAVTSWSHRIVSQSIGAAAGREWTEGTLPNPLPLAMKHWTGGVLAALVGGNGVVDPTSIEGAANMAYAIPNLRFEYAPVSHPVPITSWRSVGASHNVFVVEAFLDELARAAGKDPFEVRRALLANAPREKRVLELAAEKAGWGRPLPAGRFRGIAQGTWFGTPCAEVAEISVNGGDVRVHRVVAAVDCGLVVNPDLARAQIESGIVFGLGAALRQEITWKGGGVEQKNFDDFEPLRMHETPEIEVHVAESADHPRGIGEPGVPPIAPAVANAILAATGRPVRRLPLRRALGVGR